MLQQLEKEYLSDAYSYYQRSGERSMQYDFSSDITAKREVLRCLDALRDEGYIEYEYIATGFCGIKLTPKGIKFAENDYQELPTDNSPSIYGYNNNPIIPSVHTLEFSRSPLGAVYHTVYKLNLNCYKKPSLH